MFRMIVLMSSSCCCFFGPSSRMSYQWDGSKFSIAASSRPSALTAFFSAANSS